jgi:putative ABC transport system ATP-binding protein
MRIEARDLSRNYLAGTTTVPALLDVSLIVEPGEFVAITGRSGSGKSTLMNLLGLLDSPTGGELLFDGTRLKKLSSDQRARLRNRQLGFVFQSYQLLAHDTALQNVELPLCYRSIRASQRRACAMEALEQVGMLHRISHYPKQLSGGEQQRVAIARAIAGGPSVILADEPTGALDSDTGEAILDLLETLNRAGRTIVLVTHDHAVAARARRLIRMNNGRISEEVSTPLRVVTDRVRKRVSLS